MINQLLAGVHIAAAAEAIAFAARLGLNTRSLFNFITISGGTSWYVSSMMQSLNMLRLCNHQKTYFHFSPSCVTLFFSKAHS